jgi:hypothetical protein
MEKGVVELVVFNGEDFSYWKNRTSNYLLSQEHAILVDCTNMVRHPGNT